MIEIAFEDISVQIEIGIYNNNYTELAEEYLKKHKDESKTILKMIKK